MQIFLACRFSVTRIVLLLVFLAAGTTGLVAQDDQKDSSTEKNAEDETRNQVAQNFDSLVKSVERFRQIASTNTPAAVIRFAQKNTGKKIETLEKTLCPTSDPSRGWNCFFNTSIYSLIYLNRQTALVAFYHPWSDVFLLTTWKEGDRSHQMTDAELVMGELVRKKGQPPFEAMPQWLQGPLPPPTAAALTTAQTLRSLHQLFPAHPERKKAVNWRDLLPSLRKEEILEANRLTVGVLFERNLVSINGFFQDPKFAPVKSQVVTFIDQLKKGGFKEVMAGAPETLPESKKILASLKPEDWGRLSVVSFANTPRNDFVMLGAGGQPEVFVSFWFQKDGTDSRLRQIDIFNHQVCFQQLDQLEKVVSSSLKQTSTGKKP